MQFDKIAFSAKKLRILQKHLKINSGGNQKPYIELLL